MGMCDFCSHPSLARHFHCPDFPMDVPDLPMPPMVSKGDWMACGVCAGFIDAENWTSLLMRAVDKHSEKYPEIPRRILTDICKRSHDLFREHYKGASDEVERRI